jgi:UDP-N-acetylglucosamine diphosphorylase/glucosamine-1-phosphate N-acetyltransferase
MNSDLPKVLHEINGKTLIEHVILTAEKINADKIIAIIGYKKELVQKKLSHFNIEYATQNEQLGTGHAVKQCKKNIENCRGNMLILSGDVPLISSDTLLSLINVHKKNNSKASLISAKINNPFGYGRIVRDKDQKFVSIIEHKDANENELLINEINAGIYIFDIETLFKHLSKISNNNIQNEYYLGDVLKYLNKNEISIYTTKNINEISGINNEEQLNEIIEKNTI